MRSSGFKGASVCTVLGRIRGTLKGEPLLNPLLALLNRDPIQRVYIPKGGSLGPVPRLPEIQENSKQQLELAAQETCSRSSLLLKGLGFRV